MVLEKGKSALTGVIQKTRRTYRFVKGQVERLRKSGQKKTQVTRFTSKNKMESVILEISPWSVAKATLVVFLTMGLVYFLLQIGHILLVFFIAFLFSAALGPAVDFFERYRIPRGLGVLVVYLIIFALLGVIFSIFIPLVAGQVSDLAGRVEDIIKTLSNPDEASEFTKRFGPYLNKFYEGIDVNTIAAQLQTGLQSLAKQLLTLGGNVWGAIKVISNGLLNLLLVLVLTFIMTVNKKSINEFIPSLFSGQHSSYIVNKLAAIYHKIGLWIRGQILMSSIVAIVVFIGLTLLGFNYATALALVAFFTEFIPVIGPLLALIVAIPVALHQGLWMLLWVSVFFLVFNWIESNIIVPLVMRSAVDMSPLVILFVMLVGAQYLGFIGLILAVPVAAVVSIFVKDYLDRPKKS